MNRETSNIQFNFFIHSQFSLILYSLFSNSVLLIKVFLQAWLQLESRKWKQKSRITRKTAPPNSPLWVSLSCHPSPGKRVVWGHLWAPVLQLPRESTVTHCSTIFLFLSTFILFSFYSFFYYLCHLCCALLHHIRYFPAPPLRKAARCRLQE